MNNKNDMRRSRIRVSYTQRKKAGNRKYFYGKQCKGFKAALINVFKELKKIICKELKEGIMIMSQQIEKVYKEKELKV